MPVGQPNLTTQASRFIELTPTMCLAHTSHMNGTDLWLLFSFTALSHKTQQLTQIHQATTPGTRGHGAGGRQYVGYDIWLGLTACVAPVLHDTAQHPYCMTRHIRSYPMEEQDMEGKCKQAGSYRDKTGP